MCFMMTQTVSLLLKICNMYVKEQITDLQDKYLVIYTFNVLHIHTFCHGYYQMIFSMACTPRHDQRCCCCVMCVLCVMTHIFKTGSVHLSFLDPSTWLWVRCE